MALPEKLLQLLVQIVCDCTSWIRINVLAGFLRVDVASASIEDCAGYLRAETELLDQAIRGVCDAVILGMARVKVGESRTRSGAYWRWTM